MLSSAIYSAAPLPLLLLHCGSRTTISLLLLDEQSTVPDASYYCLIVAWPCCQCVTGLLLVCIGLLLRVLAALLLHVVATHALVCLLVAALV